MANIKISGLPTTSPTLAGNELLEMVQSGASYQTTAASIANTATNVRTVPTGGTGLATLPAGQYLKGNGASAITSSATIPYAHIVGAPTNYGAFYDTTNQTAAVNTATVMLFNSTQLVDGVTMVGGSRATIPLTGVYNFMFSAQLVNSSAADVPVSIWFRLNGITNITNSCTDISVPAKQGALNGYAVAAWNFMESLATGDYIEMMWSTTSASVLIEYLATRTTPTRPAAPSIILTIEQVS